MRTRSYRLYLYNKGKEQKKQRCHLFYFLLMCPALLLCADPFVGKSMLDRLYDEYGELAYQRGLAVNDLIESLENKDVDKQLHEVNQYFNQYEYKSDQDLWGDRDYWQSPIEFISGSAGDCEDYVIAKYFVLRFLGVPDNKLYLTYVKAKDINESHMVLTYFSTPKSVPLVLDNNNMQILPANERKDLLPVYSFNAKSLFLTNPSAGLGKKLPTDSIKNSKWAELLTSIKNGSQ